jgi:hypothetical protein
MTSDNETPCAPLASPYWLFGNWTGAISKLAILV